MKKKGGKDRGGENRMHLERRGKKSLDLESAEGRIDVGRKVEKRRRRRNADDECIYPVAQITYIGQGYHSLLNGVSTSGWHAKRCVRR